MRNKKWPEIGKCEPFLSLLDDNEYIQANQTSIKSDSFSVWFLFSIPSFLDEWIKHTFLIPNHLNTMAEFRINKNERFSLVRSSW